MGSAMTRGTAIRIPLIGPAGPSDSGPKSMMTCEDIESTITLLALGGVDAVSTAVNSDAISEVVILRERSDRRIRCSRESNPPFNVGETPLGVERMALDEFRTDTRRPRPPTRNQRHGRGPLQGPSTDTAVA